MAYLMEHAGSEKFKEEGNLKLGQLPEEMHYMPTE
jgi:hypothetical protein